MADTPGTTPEPPTPGPLLAAGPLAGTWNLLCDLLRATWLPLLMVYFVVVGGTFWASVNGTMVVVNGALTVTLVAVVLGGRFRRGLPLLPRTPLDIPLLAWAALLVASTALSVCKRLSFDVSLQQLWYFAIFYLAVCLGETQDGRRKAVWGLAAAAAAATFIGLYQFADWLADPLRDMTGAGQRIVRSTLNSHNDFAAYLTMLLPLVTAGVVALTRSTAQRAWATLLFVGMLVCLVLTYSRGGWICAPIGFLVLLAMLVRSEHLPRLRNLVGHNKVLVSLAVLGLLVALRLSPNGWLSYRLVSLVKLKDPGVSQRAMMWRDVRQMAGDRPWVGWGGGTLPLKFTAYLPSEGYRELPLHAHNQYLHYAAETGMPTVALYVVCNLLCLGVVLRRSRADGRRPELLRVACAAGIVSHLVLQMTNADVAIPSLSGTHWLLLGLAVAREGGTGVRLGRAGKVVAAAVALLGLWLCAVVLRFALAQCRYDASLNAPTPHAKSVALGRAIRLDPAHAAYRAAAADAWFRQGELDQAVAAMRAATTLSPHDALYWHNLSWLLFTRDGATDETVERMEEAVALDPRNPWYLVSLARMQLGRGWPAEAEQQLRAATRLRPSLAEAHWELGRLLAKGARLGEATAELEVCLQRVEKRVGKPDFWRPAYQVGPRYRRLPRQDEAITQIKLLTDPEPVAALLEKCRTDSGRTELDAGQEGAA